MALRITGITLWLCPQPYPKNGSPSNLLRTSCEAFTSRCVLVMAVKLYSMKAHQEGPTGRWQ